MTSKMPPLPSVVSSSLARSTVLVQAFVQTVWTMFMKNCYVTIITFRAVRLTIFIITIFRITITLPSRSPSQNCPGVCVVYYEETQHNLYVYEGGERLKETKDRQTDKQTDRQTDRKKDEKKEIRKERTKQTNKQTNKQKKQLEFD